MANDRLLNYNEILDALNLIHKDDTYQASLVGHCHLSNKAQDAKTSTYYETVVIPHKIKELHEQMEHAHSKSKSKQKVRAAVNAEWVEWVEWGSSKCTCVSHDNYPHFLRRECPICWQERKQGCGL